MSKIILAAVAAALLVVGAFLVLNRNTTKETAMPSSTVSPTSTASPNPSPSMPESTAAAHVVTLTASGFDPKTITIKAGEKVTWKNNSGMTGNVNSDNHPTHLLYPMLNLGSFKDGGTVEVVFDKPGTYTYHNHLNASQTGMVVVK